MSAVTSVVIDPTGTPATATSVVVVNDTTITAVTGAHVAGGPFAVRVSQGVPASGCTATATTATSSAIFTYLNPTATSVGPPSGAAGATITIVGANLRGTTDVLFVGPLPGASGTSDTGAPVVAASGASLTSVVPSSLAPGTYTISLVNATGVVPQSVSFTVLTPTSTVGPTPFPTAIGGSTVTVTITASTLNSGPCGLSVDPDPPFTLRNAPAPGSAIAGVNVVIVSVVDASSARAAMTDANGVATFEGIRAGIYRITSADNNDYTPALVASSDGAFGGPAGHLINSRVQNITESANLSIGLACNALPFVDLVQPSSNSIAFGQLVDYFTGAPIAGATILVNSNVGTPTSPQPGAQLASVLTDANGRWQTPEIPAGPVVARVAAAIGLTCVVNGINLCADAFQLVPAGGFASIPTPTPAPASTATPIPTAPATPTGGGPLAQILAPAPGSILPSSTVAFTWTSGIGVSARWLWVSTVLGDGNLYSQQVSALSTTVSGIPTGVPVYVRLWSLVGGNWLYIDYPYGPGVVTSTPAILPTLVTTPASTTATVVTATRTPTSSPTAASAVTSTATRTPTSTSTSGGAALAQIIGPAPGSTLPSSTVTFTWTSGTGVSTRWLWVSTVAGDGNLYSQAQSGLSATVGGVPTNTRIYVRLWSLVGGEWHFIDYQYGPGAVTSTPAAIPTSAATPTIGTPTIAPTATITLQPTATSTAGATAIAQMLAPVPGSTLTSPTTFTWTAGSGVSQYWLWVSTVEGDGNLYSQSQGTSASATVTGIPTGVLLHVRLWSLVSGEWQFVDYQYGPGAS